LARPSSRPRSAESRALTELRTSLGDSMQQFANRLHIALTTVGRYETSNPPPRGKALRRFYLLAKKHGHPSAKVFAAAMAQEKEQQFERRRMGDILGPLNVKAAGETLKEAVEAHEAQRKLMEQIVSVPQQELTRLVGELEAQKAQRKLMEQIVSVPRQELTRLFNQVDEHFRKLADLLLVGGRKELEQPEGEEPMKVNSDMDSLEEKQKEAKWRRQPREHRDELSDF